MYWEYEGIRGEGAPPPCLGQYSGPLLIVGSAACVWDDLDSFLGQGNEPASLHARLNLWADERGDVMAVNDIGIYLGCSLKHWSSKHLGHLITRYALRRQITDLKRPTLLHGHEAHPGIDHVWDYKIGGGQSGFFAMKVAVCLGYDPIVMAGCPADNTGKFTQPPDATGRYGMQPFIDNWSKEMDKYPVLRERIRSMSGTTREWLGAPDGLDASRP